jgi:hypothetical protein
VALKKKPCSFCGKWFLPDVRVKSRQRACSAPACQAARRKRTQAAWRKAHPGYFVAHRIEQLAAAVVAPSSGPSPPSSARPPPPRMPRPLDGLPWELAQDEFGAKGADFIGVFGRLLLRTAQDEMRAQRMEITV